MPEHSDNPIYAYSHQLDKSKLQSIMPYTLHVHQCIRPLTLAYE
jgi:hypothetical protein